MSRSIPWVSILAAIIAGASACTPVGPERSGSPIGGGCVVEAIFINGGPGIQLKGSSFPPDEPATLTVDDGTEAATFTQATNPALRADIRGVVLFAIGAERENVGVNRFELSAGGCTATASLEVVAAMFPPACPAGEPVASGGEIADAYAAMVGEDGPLAYWRFEEEAGPLAAATVGSDGAIQGEAGFGQAGPIDGSRALGLGGDGDWVDILDIDLTSDFTIEAWISFCGDDIGNEDAIVGGPDGSPDLNFAEGLFRAWTGERDIAIADVPLLLERWYHVAATRSGPTVTLYVDGVAVAAGDYDGSVTVAAIGRGAAGTLAGQLDEVAIYDHDLPPDRLAQRAAARS